MMANSPAVAPLDALVASLHLSPSQLLAIADQMQAQAQAGLQRTHRDLPLQMLPSYVTALPTGREQGQYLAMDFGGTNVRLCLVAFQPATSERPPSYTLQAQEWRIPESLKAGTRDELFDTLASYVRAFCTTHGLTDSLALGFTFSFPCAQHALDHGVLVQWTKGFRISGMEDQNVIALLQQALDRQPGLRVRVVALVNDTVGTLVAHGFRHPAARIGLILGTGTNAAYLEQRAAISKLPEAAPDAADAVMIINCEWGNFTPTSSLLTSLDQTLDAASTNPGRQRFEKLISGMYLPELLRLGLLEAVQLGVMPPAKALARPDVFSTQDMSDIEARGAAYVADLLRQRGLSDDPASVQWVEALTRALSSRAAQLVAAGIHALAQRIARPLAVGIDGSVWLKYHGFQARVRGALATLRGDTALPVELHDAADGSGLGAALIAAMASAASN